MGNRFEKFHEFECKFAISFILNQRTLVRLQHSLQNIQLKKNSAENCFVGYNCKHWKVFPFAKVIFLYENQCETLRRYVSKVFKELTNIS